MPVFTYFGRCVRAHVCVPEQEAESAKLKQTPEKEGRKESGNGKSRAIKRKMFL